MSVVRASMIVAGLADGDAAEDARDVVRRVAALPSPAAVADRVLEAVAVRSRPAKRRTWRVATALAASAAAIFGARAIADLESFLLGGDSGLASLPLVALLFVLLAFALPRFIGRRAEQTRREQEAARVLRALARDVPGDDALAIAAYVAEVPLASLERRFDKRHLAQNLAVASVTDRRATIIPPALVSTVLVGAAAAWAVFCFWALYFTVFGQSAGGLP